MRDGDDLVLWRVGEPKPLLQLPAVDRAKRTVAIRFQPGSTRFLTESADHQVRVWGAGASEPIATYPGPSGSGDDATKVVMFMPDGERVLTERGEHIELWRLGGRMRLNWIWV